MTPHPVAWLAFWSAAGLIGVHAGYPLALAILGVFRRRPVLGGPVTAPVSFIITAHNEGARIQAKIENTLAQTYPADALEILVASDCSSDDTDAIVAGYAPRVRLVRASERRGKEAAQYLAVTAATGDVLIFSDVATALSPDAVSTMAANFADPTVGCVSSVDRFIDAQGRPSGEGMYVRYEMFLRRLETRVNTLVGLSGSFFAARREVCRHWAVNRPSDFNTLLNSVAMGLRGVLDEQSVGYYRDIADRRREFDRKVRTVVRGLFALVSNLALLNPIRHGWFAWQLASHKVCRWLVPFAMIVAATANVVLWPASGWYLATGLLQLAFYAVAVTGLATGAASLRIPAFLLLANASVLVAWIRFARGDRIVSWTPSTRVQTLPHPGVR